MTLVSQTDVRCFIERAENWCLVRKAGESAKEMAVAALFVACKVRNADKKTLSCELLGVVDGGQWAELCVGTLCSSMDDLSP